MLGWQRKKWNLYSLLVLSKSWVMTWDRESRQFSVSGQINTLIRRTRAEVMPIMSLWSQRLIIMIASAYSNCKNRPSSLVWRHHHYFASLKSHISLFCVKTCLQKRSESVMSSKATIPISLIVLFSSILSWQFSQDYETRDSLHLSSFFHDIFPSVSQHHWILNLISSVQQQWDENAFSRETRASLHDTTSDNL